VERKKTLKELRARNLLRQDEVAGAINVSAPTYRKWESDLSTAPFGKVCELAEFFKVPVQDLSMTAKIN